MLEGKRIVVTGASRGIGRAIALACLKAGAVVGANVRTSGAPADCVPLVFDVRDRDAVERAATAFRDRAGGLDGWVNNAGVNRPSLLLSADPDAIREQIDVNLLGTIHGAAAAARIMLEQRSGVIVNVSSVAAERAARGQTIYAATKGAVESFSRALAVEVARKGIRVHAIRPGPVETDMLEATKALAEEEILARVPMKRLGRPEEIAEFAVFLLSGRCAFATGSIHTIDGGYLA